MVRWLRLYRYSTGHIFFFKFMMQKRITKRFIIMLWVTLWSVSSILMMQNPRHKRRPHLGNALLIRGVQSYLRGTLASAEHLIGCLSIGNARNVQPTCREQREKTIQPIKNQECNQNWNSGLSGLRSFVHLLRLLSHSLIHYFNDSKNHLYCVLA